MTTNRLPARENLRTLLSGDFSRIYLYPEENDDIPKNPKVPFLILDEVAGTREAGLMDASNEFLDFWKIGLYFYGSYGEHAVPSDEDAAAKVAAMAARDTIIDILISDYTLDGGVLDMGTEESVFEMVVTPLQWRGVTPAYGVYFEIPVLTSL